MGFLMSRRREMMKAAANSGPSREDLFGTFTNGRALSKKTKSSQGASAMSMYATWRVSTSSRATTKAPFVNNGYTFTVTDSSLYAIAIYGITSNTPVSTTYSNAIDSVYYQGDSATPSFTTSVSTNAQYCWISLKKNSGSFSAAELANGAEAVFTYTTT